MGSSFVVAAKDGELHAVETPDDVSCPDGYDLPIPHFTRFGTREEAEWAIEHALKHGGEAA